jgi:NADH:ubiquinone oxidoreductase subunit
MNKTVIAAQPNKRGLCGRSWPKTKITNLKEFAPPYRPKQSLEAVQNL